MPVDPTPPKPEPADPGEASTAVPGDDEATPETEPLPTFPEDDATTAPEEPTTGDDA